MRIQVTWCLKEDIPDRMRMAKSVLNKKSYGEVLDYFLRSFEKCYAEEIEAYMSKWSVNQGIEKAEVEQ